MKRILFYFLLSWALLAPGAVEAQSPGDFWNGLDTANAQDYRTTVERIFADLNPNWYPSGMILNRVPVNPIVPDLQGRLNSPEILGDEWFFAYDAMYWSHVIPSQNLPHANEIFEQAWENYNKSFSDDDFYTVPIGILDFSYERLRDDAISSGFVRANNNGDLSHIPGRGNPFQSQQLFAAAALVDTVDSDTIHWELDNFYVKGNNPASLNMLEIDFDDGQGYTRVRIGSTYSIGYAHPGDIRLKLKASYSDGKVKYAYFKIFNSTTGRQRSSNKPDQEWVHTVTGDVSGNTYKSKTGVWFSCHNTTGKVRKPAIFVTGFNPIPKSFKKFYNQFNQAGLYTELRNEGWDVIIVKWSKGVGYIEDNAEALVKVIDKINTDKQTHNDAYFENVVTGYSQGGLIARYCLARMEKLYMDGSRTTAHHCRLYVSYEGEHQGANTLLGTQLAIQGLLTTTAPLSWGIGYIIVSVAHGIYGSKAARELSFYHRSQASGTPGQGPDPLRVNFMDRMLNDFNHTATHPEKKGYPNFSRIVGVASGSSVGTKFPLAEGQKYYQKTWGLTFGVFGQLIPGYHNRLAYYALDRDPNSVVYQKFYGLGWLGGIIPIVTITRKTNGAMPYDNAPGGVEGAGQHHRIGGIINLALLYPLGGTNIGNRDCFTPTISTFDIRNHNGGPELGYNVNSFNLFRTSPGVNNPNYGYPHIAHGVNRYDYTPFDALAGTVTNDEHVKPEPGSLKNFMISEITPQWLFLQNREIGEHHSYYRADFEARQVIVLGREVTWSTEREEIKVLPSGDLRCKAVDAVIMEPGFEAEYGSYYDAYIGSMASCTHKTSPDNEDVVIQEGSTRIEQTESEALAPVNNSFSLYPNPSEGLFHLEVPELGSWEITVYDLQGREVLHQQFQGKQSFEIDLSDQASGIYNLSITGEKDVWQKRIIVR